MIPRTTEELGRYENHPLRAEGRTCRKCKSINTQPPFYPGDWFDCLDCGHSWPATDKQTAKMIHPVQSNQNH